MAIATYIVPGGAYERVVTEVNGQSRTVVLNGSFQYVENEAQGLFSVMQAPISGIRAISRNYSILIRSWWGI